MSGMGSDSPVHGLVALDFHEGLSAFVQTTLWVVAAVIGFTALMVYLLAYMSRYFEYLKMQESKYLDVGTLDFIHRVLEWVWIGILVIVIMFIAQFRSPEVRSLLTEFILRFPAVLFAIFTLFLAAVLVRALRRFGSYLRGEMRTKPQRLAPPRLWGVTELFLKYLIVGVALLVAFVGGVDILPAAVPEKATLEGIRSSLTTPSAQLFNALAIAIVGAFVAVGLGRFSDSVFDDLRQRSKKYGPQLIEQFKVVSRTAVYVLAFVTVLFLELGLFLDPTQIVVFTASFLLVALGALLITFESLRNAFAGIALMMADPFSAGDRVKVGDDLVGEVTGITLTMTQLRTGRGETVNLPNRQVLAAPVLNFTRSEHHAIFVEVAVGWEVPHDIVEKLLKDAAFRTSGILDTPPPQVFGKEVEGNAIVHQLIAYTNDPEAMKHVKSELLYAIQDLFHQKKLKMLSSAA